MEFVSLDQQLQRVKTGLQHLGVKNLRGVRYIVSPLRICPLGAHIDHQGGRVLGMTINTQSILGFVPNDGPLTKIHSTNFDSTIEFLIDDEQAVCRQPWGRYATAAARTVLEKRALKRGFTGVVSGTLIGAGLSSSTSVGLAYLRAISICNRLRMSMKTAILHARYLENKYVGMKVGLLDPATIVHGKREHLLHINTIDGTIESAAPPPNAPAYRLLIAHSGFTRQLTSTRFNARVEECHEAARLLGERIGKPQARILSDIPVEQIEEEKKHLPLHLQKRVTHYVTEVDRVERGFAAWRAGDFAKLGAFMNASCLSSIMNYESGSLPLKELHEIVSATPGVYGSRFNGGGYGGCVVAVVEATAAEAAAASVLELYVKRNPEMQHQAQVYLTDSAEGLHML